MTVCKLVAISERPYSQGKSWIRKDFHFVYSLFIMLDGFSSPERFPLGTTILISGGELLYT